MRARIATAGVIAIAGLALTACGGYKNVYDVAGTVEFVGTINATAFRNGGARVKLVDNDRIYSCSNNDVDECPLLKEGQHVILNVGDYNQSDDVENTILSIKFVTE